MVDGGLRHRGSRIYAGLDLGTTKTCAVIGQVGDGGRVRVIGVGLAPSDGLRRGVVVDVGKTVDSVTRAVGEAQLAAGVEVQSVYAGIAGQHIGSLDSSGAVAVGGQRHEVGAADRERAVAAARVVAIPVDREVLHVLPQEFAVDGQRGVRDPVGMFGVRLEASVHIVTGAVTSVQNLCRCVQRAGLEVSRIILEPLASSRAVLSEEDRESGVCLVDVGGGTADMALFFQGSVRKTAVIGLGGQSVTRDVAICLRTSWSQAEGLKREHGAAAAGDGQDGDEQVEIPGVSGRPRARVTRAHLREIVEARMEELFAWVGTEIDRSPCGGRLGAGVVLTGGGALVEGAAQLAERVLGLPVRLAWPGGYQGIGERVATPVYSTAVGLVLMAADDDLPAEVRNRSAPRLAEGRLGGVASRVKEWFRM